MDSDDVVRPMPQRRPQPQPDTAWRRWRTRILVVLIPLVLIGGALLRFWIDLLWFGELEQRDVLVTRLQWSTAMGVAFGVFTFVVLFVNFVIARRVARDDLYVPFLAVGADPEAPEQPVVPHFVLRPVLLGVAAVGAIIAGLVMSSRWEVVLRFLGRSDFGVTDPHFGRDASFYVFTMPLLELIARSIQVLLVLTAIGVVLAYVATGVIRYTPVPRVARAAVVHLSWIVAAFLLVSAFQFRLSIWSLATSTSGVVAGAGWTDTHARIPGYWLMIVASVVLAVVVVLYARRERWRVVGGAVVGWFVASIIVTGLIPSLVQNVLVEPNELERETELIEGNIHNTRVAFGLDSIRTASFRDQKSLTAAELQRDNTGTTDNLRLWSPSVLLEVLKQEQVIRRYYTFVDPDVDRYTIGDDYRQVMVSVRELDPAATGIAPGWTNERLAYTHGYGAVATLPNEVTNEGRPEYLLRNLPPTLADDAPDGADVLSLERPEVYFGEANDDYVIVRSRQEEVSGADAGDAAEQADGDDAPTEANGEGDEAGAESAKDADGADAGDASNERTSYQGEGGIRISGFARRVALATTFRDPRILFSGQFTEESRFMFRRRITERVRTLAPFLELDRDPYAVIYEGRIVWIVDAYTTSDRFPYSQAIPLGGTADQAAATARTPRPRSVNYVRNSVKAVVDAYEGDVTLYAMDDEDPILQSWRDIFPDLFTSAAKMPDELRAHLRYPEDLFGIQTEHWKRYHMGDVADFYQREDEWDVPTIGNEPMQAFYVLARMPQAESEELLLIRPLTPRGRKNMVAYMVARSDGEQYGEIRTLRLSTQEVTQGPSQVQARIRQDSTVSEQVRQWEVGQNRVIFGDLLVLPIEDSLLYAQPVYLQNEEARIPEFQRIVLVLGDTVAWGDDFPQAARELLEERATDAEQDDDEDTDPQPDTDGGDTTPEPDGDEAPDTDLPRPDADAFEGMTQAELARVLADVSAAYDRAEACQEQGDTVCFAREVERIEQLLADARPDAS